jgi:hypothetical protein
MTFSGESHPSILFATRKGRATIAVGALTAVTFALAAGSQADAAPAPESGDGGVHTALTAHPVGHAQVQTIPRQVRQSDGLAARSFTVTGLSALHGIATLTRTRRLRPDYRQARLTMLAGQLAGVPG